VPALALSRADLHDSLKEGGRSNTSGVRGRRLRAVLVSAEVAIALVLAVGATLMIRTFAALSEVDPGFDPESVLAGTVELPRHKLKDQNQVFTFYDTVIRRIRTLPGVMSAGMTNSLPLGGNYFRGDWRIEGRAPVPGKPLMLNQRTVDPEYFKALRIPLRSGRYIDERDRKGAPAVVMINETAARRLFPGEDPVGKRIGDPGAWNTIVGVTADIRHTDVSLGADTELMLPFHQFPAAVITFVVRLDPGMYPDPNRFAPLLRRAVSGISADQAVFQVASLEQVMANRLAPRKLSMAILIWFSALSLILSAMGIYGVLAFSVEQRTHEIGVRMALGARQGDVVRMVVREGAVLAVAGLAVGLVAAIGLTRLAKSILYGVTATDPLAFTGTAILLAVIAAVASYIPARRATRVDPLVALRYE
jgi:putative ABC transport system permease protein